MVLLLQGVKEYDEIWYRYLHSNMVLLLPKAILGLNNNNSTFTFQYGATSTDKANWKWSSEEEFTFQCGATSTAYHSHNV